MKMKFGLIALMTTVLSSAAFASTWHEGATKAANDLAEKIEVLDERMHELKADPTVVNKIHHFEDTVLEFSTDLRDGLEYSEARKEFEHVAQDIIAIYHALNDGGLFRDAEVLNRWNATAGSYNHLLRFFQGCSTR